MELLTITDLENLLKLSASQIRHKLMKARRGEIDFPLPITNIGERTRWLKSDVEYWILKKSSQKNAQQSIQPPTKPRSQKQKSKRLLDVHNQLKARGVNVEK
jgi:predicted DNA-binding transcriptional regulator AlpA